jgi:hypothetical protein
VKLVQIGSNVAFNPAHVVKVEREGSGTLIRLTGDVLVHSPASPEIIVAAIEKGLNS